MLDQNKNSQEMSEWISEAGEDSKSLSMPEWIIVIDEDRESLLIAESILSEAGMRVTALTSGQELVNMLQEEGLPDLILLDIYMSEQEEFETLQLLKGYIPEGTELPLIFITDEEHLDLTKAGFAHGAMDFVRKPYEADVLVSRVQNVISVRKKMHQLAMDAVTDSLTGLYNRPAIDDKLEKLVKTQKGMLCLLDLDHFKSINDLYGHDMGDRILVMFSTILKKRLLESGVCGRIGGDEFLLFTEQLLTEDDLTKFCNGLNKDYIEGSKMLLGAQLQIPVGISIGAVSVPEYGTELKYLFHMADQATYFVKENGRHGCRLYSHSQRSKEPLNPDLDLETVTAILEERNVSPNAMWMGKEMFGSIYRYLVRYMDRYHSSAYRVLLTVKPELEISEEDLTEIMSDFNEMLRSALRNSDVMMECGDHQVFLLLPEIQEYDIDRVLKRLLRRWESSPYYKMTKVRYECGPVHQSNSGGLAEKEKQNWVVIADNDEANQKKANLILSKQNLRVTCLSSGKDLVDLLMHDKPDLILLGVELPGMDGFETLKEIRKMGPDRSIPLIFLTEGDNLATETKCLTMGATDFIRKPYVPEVLILRVRHTLQLITLQNNVAAAVERKIKEYQNQSVN